jgi:threonylcarbamoyladenosine tRNA methylthiotransferase CDKAL1
MPPLTLPVIRSNPLVDIIPISLGCLSACAYCKTKHARGHLRSYPPEAIIARALAAARDGCTQIWLTSEDSGAYGSDIGTTLPALLSELTTTLARDAPHVMVRVGMTNPTYLRDPAVLSGLCDALLSRNMFQFLHIPIQSGSDDILTAMRREYTALEFEQIVTELRRRIPGIGLATDIICGYPTEDDAAWRSTMALVQRHEFPILHSSQFYPRPGTPAARLPRLPGTVVKARSSELARWSATLSPFSSLVGTMQEVWLIEERRADGGEKTILVGHTREYVHVMLPHGAAQDGQDASIDAWLLAAMRAGTPVLVRITECSRNGVRGEPQREL